MITIDEIDLSEILNYYLNDQKLEDKILSEVHKKEVKN